MKATLIKDSMRDGGRLLLAALVAFVVCLPPVFGGARVFRQQQTSVETAGFVSLALPASGEVRVENQRGPVELEVWDEGFVGVASVGGEAAAGKRSNARRSPVQIEKTDRLLSILVPRSTVARAEQVELRLRLPRAARAKIFTSGGAIALRGSPSQLSAQTVSGEIRLEVAAGDGVDLSAHSLNGTVTFDGGGGTRPTDYVKQKFETRIGDGGSIARLFSGRGRISVNTQAVGSREPSSAVVRSDSPLVVADRPRASASPVARQLPGVVRRGERRTSAPVVVATPLPTNDEAGERETAAPVERRRPTLEGRGAGQATPNAQPTPGAPEEVDEDEVIRVESDLVTINVSVVDRAGGRGVVGLAREEFRLSEDNVEQQLEHFEASNAPFDLVLLIDLSGSTGRVTDIIRAAALRFIDAARTQDRIAVITFAGAANIVSPLTADRTALRASVRAMGPPIGDTRLYDAAGAALDLLDKSASAQRRRAVVLMSDGLDSTLPNVTGTGSQLSYDELRSRVEEFEGLFYVIWTSTEYEAFSPLDIQPETFDLASERLQQLAETGGGVFYEVEKLEDLAGAYERVVEDLGTVYSLSYRPTNKTRDGRFRAIRVRVARPNAVARGRRGYYAN